MDATSSKVRGESSGSSGSGSSPKRRSARLSGRVVALNLQKQVTLKNFLGRQVTESPRSLLEAFASKRRDGPSVAKSNKTLELTASDLESTIVLKKSREGQKSFHEDSFLHPSQKQAQTSLSSGRKRRTAHDNVPAGISPIKVPNVAAGGHNLMRPRPVGRFNVKRQSKAAIEAAIVGDSLRRDIASQKNPILVVNPAEEEGKSFEFSEESINSTEISGVWVSGSEKDGVDMEKDVEADVGRDVESDVESDVRRDVESDVGRDVESDVGRDVESDVESDVGRDVESDVRRDVESDVGRDVESDMGRDVEAIVERDVDAIVGVPSSQSETQADMETEESRTVPGKSVEYEADSDVGIEEEDVFPEQAVKEPRTPRLPFTPRLPPKAKTPVSVRKKRPTDADEIQPETSGAARPKSRATAAASGGRPRKRLIQTSIPRSLTHSAFQFFAGMKVSKEALEEVDQISEVFFSNVLEDLEAYAKHGRRTIVERSDMELLMKRQRFVTENTSLNALIEKHLALEDRETLIPIARAGNRLE